MKFCFQTCGTGNLISYFGGYWYSTPRLGMCTGDHRPGDGSGCTWRLAARPYYIEAPCLVDRLLHQLVQANATCFKPCGAVYVSFALPV